MKITIPEYKSITNMELDLANYTVLAGKNNAGKSNIISYINELLTKDKTLQAQFDVIYVPSQDISPDPQCNSSLKTSNFSKMVNPILEKIVSKEILQETIKNFDKSEGKKNFENKVNKLLEDFGVSDKTFGIKIHSDNFDEEIIRKLVGAFATDHYRNELVNLKDMGQGTQRLVAAALIIAYSNLINDDAETKKTVILFEEPEVFLHPELKLNLHKALKTLSKKGHIVVISTHDPYFIQLNTENDPEEGRIYNIKRDGKNTVKEESLDTNRSLSFDSHAEINYKIFNLPTATFFQELYESIKHQFELVSGSELNYYEFDSQVITQPPLSLVADKTDKRDNKITYLTELRHAIAHPRTASPDQVIIGNGIRDLLTIKKIKKLQTIQAPAPTE